MKKFHSNGKLLITGEYLVLDGALALAVPYKLGQSLTFIEHQEAILNWKSFNSEGELWFKTILIQKILKLLIALIQK